jgi:hypothetical protein
MTKYSGSDLYITFGGTVISDHGASLDVPEEHEAPDVTAFGDDDGEYVPGGVTHRKATFEGFDDSTETVYDALAPGTEAELVYQPQGNVAGDPTHTVTAIVTKRERGFKIGDKVALKAEFQLTGSVADGTVAA